MGQRMRVGLLPALTGLEKIVWLRRRREDDAFTLELSNEPVAHSDSAIQIMIEPVAMVLSGELSDGELDNIKVWISLNYDLIEGYWEGNIMSGREAAKKVRPLSNRSW